MVYYDNYRRDKLGIYILKLSWDFYILSILISTLVTVLLIEASVRLFVDNGFNYEIEMMKYAKNIKRVESVNGYKIFLHR